MLASYARFDLGRSFLQNKEVWQLIKEKLPVSISLGLWSFLIAYAISIPLASPRRCARARASTR